MTDVLITAGELADLLKTGAVCHHRHPQSRGLRRGTHPQTPCNVHEIFTYLATSTPEGMQELKTKFADAFGGAGLSGKETAVIYEQSMNSGFGQSLPRLLSADHARLSQDQGGAWRLRRLGRRGPADHDRRAVAGEGVVLDRAGGRRYSDRRRKPCWRRSASPVSHCSDVRDVDEWIGESSSPYGKDFCPRKVPHPRARSGSNGTG